MKSPHAIDSKFEFERDTLPYANELIWQYHFDPQTGAMTVRNNEPPPTYAHHCFVVVRTARQFFYHARFEPGMARLAESEYRTRVREVVRRNPRAVSAPAERVVFPGYGGLRSFAKDFEVLLKQECGGGWQSYCLRSHWRMVFPTPGSHQEGIARSLVERTKLNLAPTVHIFRFPKVTINHGLLIYGAQESGDSIHFQIYDPNLPDKAGSLTYDKQRKIFLFPPTTYWGGGPVKVVEIYLGGLY